MNALWNQFNLDRPPYITWRIKTLDTKAKGVNIDLLKFVINTAISDLTSMDILHLEATVLSRLIYRMKSKFRNDKGLKRMAQLNKALLNYYNMGLLEEYKTLQPAIEMENGIYNLPSKQVLEYVLVRTQGFGKLMARVEELARHAGHFLKARIKLGHAWSISLIAYATVSRIWIWTRSTLKKCCKWYEGLYSCAKNFQYIGQPWIPENQSLPSDLKLWLSLDWLDEEISISHNKTWEKTIFKLLKPQASDNADEISCITSDNSEINKSRMSQEDISAHNVSKNEYTPYADINDIGEVIDRETFKKSLPKISRNTGIPSARKRKHVNIESNAETIEKLKKKKENRETMPRTKRKRKRSKLQTCH